MSITFVPYYLFSMIGKVFGALLWAILADKWKCHRLLIILTCIASIMTMIGQLFVGMTFAVSKEAAQCKSQLITIKTQEDILNSTIPAKATEILKEMISNTTKGITDTSLMTTMIVTQLPIYNISSTYPFPITTATTGDEFGALFTAMLILSVMNLFFDCSLEMLDTGTIRKVQLYSSNNRKVNYGGQRWVAPIGAIFGNFASNLSVQYFPKGSLSCYTGMVICFTFLSILTLISTLLTYRGLSFENVPHCESSDKKEIQDCCSEDDECKLVSSTLKNDCEIKENFEGWARVEGREVNQNKKGTSKTTGTGRQFLKTLVKAKILFLMISTAVSGMLFAPLMSFAYPFLRELNVTPILFSVVTAVGAIGGALAFRFSNKIIKSLTPWHALILCYALTSSVHLMYGMSRTFLLPVSSRPFYGFARCLALSAGLTYLKKRCPINVLTSIISFYVLMFNGVGPGIGLAVCGKVFDAYNGKTLFRGSAVLTLCWTFIVLVYVILKRNKRRFSSSNEEDLVASVSEV